MKGLMRDRNVFADGEMASDQTLQRRRGSFNPKAKPELFEIFDSKGMKQLRKRKGKRGARGARGGRPKPVSARAETPVPVPSWSLKDAYALLIVLLLVPFAIVVYAASFILLLIPLAIFRAYRQCFPDRVDRVRDSVTFPLVVSIFGGLLMSPYMLLATIWLLLVHLVVFILSYPIGLCFEARTKRSLEVFRQYSNIPGFGTVFKHSSDKFARAYGYGWTFNDILNVVVGMLDRRKFFTMASSMSVMSTLLPVVKIAVTCNPYLFDMEEVYINQWSLPIDAIGDHVFTEKDLDKIKVKMQTAVCRSFVAPENNEMLDHMPFSAHYPYPPMKRESKCAAGMQYSERIKTTLLTHSVHSYDIEGYKARSKNAVHGFWSVYLQTWNPYHQLTGYVEVNIRADGGIEHPMWLIADPTSRLHSLNLKRVNRLFVKLGWHFKQFVEVTPNQLGDVTMKEVKKHPALHLKDQ
mmetsp:Transcript_16106/g.24288  ORF Transcript_16106/g.24288 Transcript_16106/m.24288 type:complete len:465 (-) Transcript_16106:249-1643(-)|eukprot:CAMPEP_0167755788 /NCGR_PEP_ID=MMETSP0110_2-20121227/9019_1 /TAXON_ID=629695 /ORGANISM="Gymnochlora sp., Strain CCMP2014" /LENGTH=464 /DNA_ID=CAMNT_0007641815 /DNA_START=70 /DNA_END=1464 /DNA_ORIENTATION=-